MGAQKGHPGAPTDRGRCNTDTQDAGATLRAQQTRRRGERQPGQRQSVRMGGSDNKGDGLASQLRRYRVLGQPLLNRHQVGQMRVMGRCLMSKHNGCCGGSLLSYRIVTLLTFFGAGRERPARGGSHACLTHGLLLLKMNSFFPGGCLPRPRWAVCATGAGAHQGQTSCDGERDIWWTVGTMRGGAGHLGLTHTGRLWAACGQQKRSNDPGNNQHNLNTPTTGRH